MVLFFGLACYCIVQHPANAATILQENFNNDPVANGRATIAGNASRFTYSASAQTMTAHYDNTQPTAKMLWSLGQTFDQTTDFRIDAAFTVSNLNAPTGFGSEISFGLLNSAATGNNRAGKGAGPYSYDIATLDYFPNTDAQYSPYQTLTPTVIQSAGSGTYYSKILFPQGAESYIGQTEGTTQEPTTLANLQLTASLSYQAQGALGRTLSLTVANSNGFLPINVVGGNSGIPGGLDGDPTTIQLILPNTAQFSVNDFGLTLWNDSFYTTSGGFSDVVTAADLTFTKISVSNTAVRNQWTGSGGGIWNSAGNWSDGVVPNGNTVTDTVFFGDQLTASSLINLGNSDQTVSQVKFSTFSNASCYTIGATGGGKLILDGTHAGGAAAIVLDSANDNDHTISAPIQYVTNTTITNSSLNNHALILSGRQDWGGNTITVAQGAVQFNASTNAVNTSGATLSISNGATVELAGTASSTSDGTNSVNVSNAGTLNVTGTGQRVGNITGSGDTKVGTVSGNGNLTANHIIQSTLTIGTNTTTTGTATVTINATNPSAYVLPGDTTVPTGSSSGTSILTSLAIANDGAGNYFGTLDLKNNNLVINYTTTTSPIDGIRQAILSAYNNGNWNGTGLTSSTILQDTSNFALGFGENNDPSNALRFDNAGNPFEGTPVNTTSVLVKFTWKDDLTLDGVVDSSDAIVFGTNYDNGATTGHSFAQGDLNYDGVIDSSDAIIFGTAYNTSLAQLPEPSSFVLAGLGLVGLLVARRRRARFS